MSILRLAPTRRGFLVGLSAVSAAALGVAAGRGLARSDQGTSLSAPEYGAFVTETPTTGGSTALRQMRINIPDEALDDLRRRISGTRWPDAELVADRSQGAQLAKVQELVHYWGTGYDWRKVESQLNSWPNFLTELDGLDVHFMHIRSPHANAMPLIMTHGWPGSILELIKVIGPLTDPTNYGGSSEDAFHLVLPSMPGYGFRLFRGAPVGLPTVWHVHGTN